MGTLIGEWRTDGELDRGIRKSWRIRCSRGMGNRWGIRQDNGEQMRNQKGEWGTDGELDRRMGRKCGIIQENVEQMGN